MLRNTQAYLDSAVLSPLERHGVKKAAYQKLFDPFVKPAASTRDRAILTEANPPLTRGVVNGRASRVRLDALGDQNGKVVLIAATFTLTVNASTKAGPLKIVRLTELTFQNEFGRWVIAAYHVSVRRTIGKRPPRPRPRNPGRRTRREPRREVAHDGTRPTRRSQRACALVLAIMLGIATLGAAWLAGYKVPAGVRRDLPPRAEARAGRLRLPVGRARTIRSSCCSSATTTVRESAARAATRCTSWA